MMGICVCVGACGRWDEYQETSTASLGPILKIYDVRLDHTQDTINTYMENGTFCNPQKFRNISFGQRSSCLGKSEISYKRVGLCVFSLCRCQEINSFRRHRQSKNAPIWLSEIIMACWHWYCPRHHPPLPPPPPLKKTKQELSNIQPRKLTTSEVHHLYFWQKIIDNNCPATRERNATN